MKQKKILRAGHGVGFALILSGFMADSFIVVRPNRIEDGIVMCLKAAMGGRIFLLAALFLCLLLAVLLRERGGNIVKKAASVVGIPVFGAYLFMTGAAGKAALAGMTSAARVSLGYGFWMMLLGLMLILWQCGDEAGFSNRMMAGCIVACVGLYASGSLSGLSLFREISDKGDRLLEEILRHMQLSLSAVFTGLILSLLLSYGAYRKPWMARMTAGVANFAQIVPTLSLLGLLMIPLALLAARYPMLKAAGISGIGFFPAYVVLTLYTLLPITSSALAGFQTIPPTISEAASAMGMTRWQMLLKIELPMAFPSIYTGFRTALVQTVGNCILAGLVGGGGLGAILFLGLAQSAPDLVMASALLVAAIAVVLDVLLKSAELWLRKRLRGELAHDRI